MILGLSIKDIIDALVVLALIVYAYRVMRDSRSIYVFNGIVLFVLLWLLVSKVLKMQFLGGIMTQLIDVGLIGLIVLFQEDIRRFLYNLGANRRTRYLLSKLGIKQSQKSADHTTVMPIVMACTNMAKQKVGALIVIERAISLEDLVDAGERVDAQINQRLIENIFFKNSPLHDGAVIIANGRIRTAGGVLPVAHDEDIPREFGLRHRAALGVSQNSDAIAIVVSEETGKKTLAINGSFRMRVSAEELEMILTN